MLFFHWKENPLKERNKLLILVVLMYEKAKVGPRYFGVESRWPAWILCTPSLHPTPKYYAAQMSAIESRLCPRGHSLMHMDASRLCSSTSTSCQELVCSDREKGVHLLRVMQYGG